MGPLLCLSCALEGAQLRRAVTVHGGVSLCPRHLRRTSGEATGSNRSGRPGAGLRCGPCRQSGREHVARFVLDAEPLCIRHAADAVHPDDDMRAHDLAHGLYLRLHAGGEPDRY
jgi:hypothetical protein